jgi:hypothetical protein
VGVLATTEVMKQWASIAAPSPDELSQVLEAIERFGNYRPGRKAVEYAWWAAANDASGCRDGTGW